MNRGKRNNVGWLLDLYPQRDDIILWFIMESGERRRIVDRFEPSFYVRGLTARNADDFQHNVASLPGLTWIGMAEKRDFWTDCLCTVSEIRITDMDRYKTSLHRLFRLHPDLAYYNCDIVPEIHYGYERGIFPTAKCEITTDGDRLVACRVLDDPYDTNLPMPPLRIAELQVKGQRLSGRKPHLESLSLIADGRELVWDECAPREMLRSLSEALRENDPDLIWTHGGDTVVLPALFDLAARAGMTLWLDREPGIRREMILDGRSYMSYGRVLYQAPDYPLYGRWHVDARNSFWSTETGLEGLVEVARLSKIPVQRAARRSIGTGISSIQLDLAYRQGYLIPWKKSQPEAWKSAATLLKADRGGLVYQPLTGVYEDVIELDFVSMYPTIMVRCNVSPETVNCTCCEPQSIVPQIEYSICRRRAGLTSVALGPIIAKRKQYKAIVRELAARAKSDPEAAERRTHCDRCQGAIKWLLVCCFGYLGYRNARFGRIEAHEATCAFSREKLIEAKEVCEAQGFDVLHAIVDCFWLRRAAQTNDDQIAALCREIETVTGLDIAVEGRYRWIVFLPSRRDSESPVPNRYFGCFHDGKLKYRGIEVRRHDQVPFAQKVQEQILELLRGAENVAAIRAMKDELFAIYREAEAALRTREVDMENLILRRATSMEAEEYRGNNMTAVAARQARRAGLPLHAGEAVKFVVINAKDRDPDSRLRLVALLRPEDAYDVAFYQEQVRRAAATVLEPFFGAGVLDPIPVPNGAAKSRRASKPCINATQGELFGGFA